jgi:hypothetical protein
MVSAIGGLAGFDHDGRNNAASDHDQGIDSPERTETEKVAQRRQQHGADLKEQSSQHCCTEIRIAGESRPRQQRLVRPAAPGVEELGRYQAEKAHRTRGRRLAVSADTGQVRAETAGCDKGALDGETTPVALRHDR